MESWLIWEDRFWILRSRKERDLSWCSRPSSATQFIENAVWSWNCSCIYAMSFMWGQIVLPVSNMLWIWGPPPRKQVFPGAGVEPGKGMNLGGGWLWWAGDHGLYGLLMSSFMHLHWSVFASSDASAWHTASFLRALCQRLNVYSQSRFKKACNLPEGVFAIYH